jgi:hypothetical protein
VYVSSTYATTDKRERRRRKEAHDETSFFHLFLSFLSLVFTHALSLSLSLYRFASFLSLHLFKLSLPLSPLLPIITQLHAHSYPEAPVTATIVSLLAIVTVEGGSEAAEKKSRRAWCKREGSG